MMPQAQMNVARSVTQIVPKGTLELFTLTVDMVRAATLFAGHVSQSVAKAFVNT